MKHIAIFASGKGSNADNICRYFNNHASMTVKLIVTDRKDAGVIDVAKKWQVEYLYINKQGWQNIENVIEELRKRKIDLVVLAGFLKLIPLKLVQAYNRRIINIHPALLPKYGGIGMYGMNVHDAVYKAKEIETGITIHYVDEHYDEGDIIFQAKTTLHTTDTPSEIAARIHQLEMDHFPSVIEKLPI